MGSNRTKFVLALCDFFFFFKSDIAQKNKNAPKIMLLLIFGIFKTVIIQSQGFYFAFSVWKIITFFLNVFKILKLNKYLVVIMRTDAG